MKFPKEAEAVRKYIRDNVGRPIALPIFRKDIQCLRWGKFLRRCPLGLLPNAHGEVPDYIGAFSTPVPFTQNQMEIFYEWFDKLTDPQYAVDTVWGD